MVNVAKIETKNITSNAAIILAVIALIFTATTIYVITSITGSFYVAGYYTISALFDAVGVDESAVLGSLVTNFSSSFYAIVGLSIIDGLIKIIIVGFVIAALIDLVISLKVREKLSIFGRHRLKNHVIICGYSFLADRVALKLAEAKVPFVVVDRNPNKIDLLRELGFPMIHDNFETEHALHDASIDTARAVLFLAPSDYSNLLGVITAKHLNKNVKVIARAEDDNTITKIHRAGAEFCVVPEVLAGLEIGEAILAGKVQK